MNAARCKFRCTAVTDYGSGYLSVKLDAQYDEALSHEDRAFAKNTPTGSFEARIFNPALDGFFVPGKSYFLDVTPAE